MIKRRKTEYYNGKIGEAGNYTNNKLYNLDRLTGNSKEKKLPESYSDRVLADEFLEFFKSKIENIVSDFAEAPRHSIITAVVDT